MEEKELEFEETLENPQDAPQSENEEVETSVASDDVDTLKSELEKLRKINSQLYARLKKTEAKVEKTEKVADTSIQEKIERLEFKISHPDLEQEHFEYIEAFARGKGISLEEAFKNPMVQKAIQKDIEDKKLSSAASGGRSASSNIKTFSDEIKEASKDAEKHKELWEKFVSGSFNRTE